MKQLRLTKVISKTTSKSHTEFWGSGQHLHVVYACDTSATMFLTSLRVRFSGGTFSDRAALKPMGLSLGHRFSAERTSSFRPRVTCLHHHRSGSFQVENRIVSCRKVSGSLISLIATTRGAADGTVITPVGHYHLLALLVYGDIWFEFFWGTTSKRIKKELLRLDEQNQGLATYTPNK